MGRHQKNTIDYFPHYVHDGKTIFILENKFGNDGYAFWFKLLELLGKTQGHFYDCNNIDEWEFLLAKTKVDEVSGTEILNTLAKLKGIDKELWDQRVIWSQNFVDNIGSVYRKRGLPVPTKPNHFFPKKENVSVTETQPQEHFCNRNEGSTGVSVEKGTQSIVEYSKEENHIYAGRVYDHYKEHIKAGAKRDAIVSIKKLLSEGKTTEELMEYIDNYEKSIKQKGTEPVYKIQANNFFGIKARWLEYTTPPDEETSDPRARELLSKFYKLYSEAHQGRPPFVVELDLSTAEKITRIYKHDQELEQCITLFFTEKLWRRYSDNREPESFKQFYLVIQTLMEHLPKKSPWSKK